MSDLTFVHLIPSSTFSTLHDHDQDDWRCWCPAAFTTIGDGTVRVTHADVPTPTGLVARTDGLEPETVRRLTAEAARVTTVEQAFDLAVRVVHYARTAEIHPNTAYTGAAAARRLLEQVTGQALSLGYRKAATS